MVTNWFRKKGRGAAADAETIASRGVTLEGLRDLLNSVAKTLNRPPNTVLTKELRDYVIRQTRRQLQPYHDVLPTHHKAQPSVFVSYWSGSSFEKLVDALECYFRSSDDRVGVWVDLIALNQHEACLQDDLDKLPDVINRIGTTQLFLDSGVCLQRLWCAYEILRSMPGRPGSIPRDLQVLPPSDWHRAVLEVYNNNMRACRAFFVSDSEALRKKMVPGKTNALGHQIRSIVLKRTLPCAQEVFYQGIINYAACHEACLLQAEANHSIVAAHYQPVRHERLKDAEVKLRQALNKITSGCATQSFSRWGHPGVRAHVVKCLYEVLLRLELDLAYVLALLSRLDEHGEAHHCRKEACRMVSVCDREVNALRDAHELPRWRDYDDADVERVKKECCLQAA